MMLYLCRHAIAADAEGHMKDADRPLTQEGIRKFRRAAEGFLSLRPEVSHVLTSPLLRARQTAEILLEALAQRKEHADLVVAATLAPPGKLSTFLEGVTALKRPTGVVAVAHEPFLSAWVGQICFASSGMCRMKKGAIAAIEFDSKQHRGTLQWLMQPAQLRDL